MDEREYCSCKEDGVFCKTSLFITRPIHSSIFKKEPMIATQEVNKHASKCRIAGFSLLIRNENNSRISSKLQIIVNIQVLIDFRLNPEPANWDEFCQKTCLSHINCGESRGIHNSILCVLLSAFKSSRYQIVNPAEQITVCEYWN